MQIQDNTKNPVILSNTCLVAKRLYKMVVNYSGNDVSQGDFFLCTQERTIVNLYSGKVLRLEEISSECRFLQVAGTLILSTISEDCYDL
jgi:hypothetical protein